MAARYPTTVIEDEVLDIYDQTDQPLTNAGWNIQVHETNYHFEKRFPVLGDLSIGQLIVLVVKEIGK
jgi:hypothetical protein